MYFYFRSYNTTNWWNMFQFGNTGGKKDITLYLTFLSYIRDTKEKLFFHELNEKITTVPSPDSRGVWTTCLQWQQHKFFTEPEVDLCDLRGWLLLIWKQDPTKCITTERTVDNLLSENKEISTHLFHLIIWSPGSPAAQEHCLDQNRHRRWSSLKQLIDRFYEQIPLFNWDLLEMQEITVIVPNGLVQTHLEESWTWGKGCRSLSASMPCSKM